MNLPINLRAFFGSNTASNFFAVTAIDHEPGQGRDEFEEILASVCRQMDEKIVKEKLEETISYNVSNEKKWYVRILPLFVKWLALGFIFRRNDRAHTITLSNIGLISMDREYQDDIEGFRILIGGVKAPAGQMRRVFLRPKDRHHLHQGIPGFQAGGMFFRPPEGRRHSRGAGEQRRYHAGGG